MMAREEIINEILSTLSKMTDIDLRRVLIYAKACKANSDEMRCRK